MVRIKLKAKISCIKHMSEKMTTKQKRENCKKSKRTKVKIREDNRRKKDIRRIQETYILTIQLYMALYGFI